jgi:UDP-2,3-diacylglucosamine hydrolase
MLNAVFISDLHLHPHDEAIKARFDGFVLWAKSKVNSIYILGDFFHVWPGDDAQSAWSLGIATQLHSLVAAGKSVYFLPGNRDFLLGKQFARLAAWKVLPDPVVIELGKDKILLSHGDRFCTSDRGHQVLMALTRNDYFIRFFLRLPLSLRQRLVSGTRRYSQTRQKKKSRPVDVVDDAVKKDLQRYGASILIHGHTHQPGVIHYDEFPAANLTRYVLSDWDDKPQLLCYHSTKGFYFTHLEV